MSARRGFIIILSAPSGAGKTTLARYMTAHLSDIHTSVSTTTRAPRPGEVDGVDYYFTDVKTFRADVQRAAFMEWAEVFGNYYGTGRSEVESKLNAGQDVLLDIDWQGAQQVRKSMDSADVISISIVPPSYDALYTRLKGRGTDDDSIIQKRMNQATREMSHWDEYDYIVVNDQIEPAQVELTAIVQAERLKRSRIGGRIEQILATFPK
ncbi:MAG: guanylate kinase [Magnetococcales bacterium]|nr:guanylate kinase [Magnetococcales bacterium]